LIPGSLGSYYNIEEKFNEEPLKIVPALLLTGVKYSCRELHTQNNDHNNFPGKLRRCIMAKYLFHGSYTEKGLKGLAKDGGTKRSEETRKAVESLGGKLEAYYFAGVLPVSLCSSNFFRGSQLVNQKDDRLIFHNSRASICQDRRIVQRNVAGVF
jgi:hypothetical protein